MNIYIECEYCGEEYKAKRSSRKYCSDTCKTMAYRKRKQRSIEILDKLDKWTKEQLRKIPEEKEYDNQPAVIDPEFAREIEKLRNEMNEYYRKKWLKTDSEEKNASEGSPD